MHKNDGKIWIQKQQQSSVIKKKIWVKTWCQCVRIEGGGGGGGGGGDMGSMSENEWGGGGGGGDWETGTIIPI